MVIQSVQPVQYLLRKHVSIVLKTRNLEALAIKLYGRFTNIRIRLNIELNMKDL